MEESLRQLEGIGLTRGETLVYMALLRLGQSSIGKISKDSEVSSSKVYEILERLIKKGLASYIIKNNVRHYAASDPEKIREYVRKRREELARKEKSLEKIIPLLREKRISKPRVYSAEVYEGFRGFKTAVLSLVKEVDEDSEILAFGGSGIRNISIGMVWMKFGKMCEKRRIKNRVIVTDTSRESLKLMEDFRKSILKNMELRFLSGFHLAPVMVAGNTILIINFDELTCIFIRSPAIAEQFKFFFESLWRIAKSRA